MHHDIFKCATNRAALQLWPFAHAGPFDSQAAVGGPTRTIGALASALEQTIVICPLYIPASPQLNLSINRLCVKWTSRIWILG